MAKLIKRVGIVFFVIAISVLLVVGCFYFVEDKSAVEASTNKLNENIEEIKATLPTVPSGDIVHLLGDSAEMLNGWKQAKARSREENKIIEVILDSDWLLTEQLVVDYNEKIVLNLNARTIDRNMSAAAVNGGVIKVLGRLYITDGEYIKNATAIKEEVTSIYNDFEIDVNAEYDETNLAYDENIVNYVESFKEKLSDIKCGKITGGWTSQDGGAVLVTESNGFAGNCFVFGGLFYNNRAGRNGAAFAATSTIGTMQNANTLWFNDGIIAGNRAEGVGCAIYTKNCYGAINNIYACGNISIKGAGAVYIFHSSDFSIDNINVFCNYAYYGAGIYAAGGHNDSSQGHVALVINHSVISRNVALRQGGGIYVTNSTSTALLNSTITNNIALCRIEDEARGGGGLQVYYTAHMEASNLTIKNNYSKIRGGGIYIYPDANLLLSGTNDISDNYTENGLSDLYISKHAKLDIGHSNLKFVSAKGICVELAEDYEKFAPFTLGWLNKKSADIDPNTYFYSNVNNAFAKLKNGEVAFDYSSTSKYDFVYLEDNYRKYYRDNDKLYGYNDSNLNVENGVNKYILGKILSNTSVNEFIKNIEPLGFDKNNLELFNNTGKLIYQNGNSASGVNAELLDNKYELSVGTGWYLEYNTDTGKQKIYLSVLGDVTGDGKINAIDITYLRQVANSMEIYDSLSIEKKLASLIVNIGKVTTADSEIIRNVLDLKIDISIFLQ